MEEYRILKRWTQAAITLLCLCCMGLLPVKAQDFKVASFRQLPNDVSAFINNVRDLNDEACALVKVVGPADFAFSSPLGIVKRQDEVGEIWLYLPRGTKTLTLKHPQWGVLRNYPLGKPLESRMTYELRLQLPKPAVRELHDTIIQVKTVTDTITVKAVRRHKLPRVPWGGYGVVTLAMHQDGPSFGVMGAVMRRHGIFFHVSSRMTGGVNTEGLCDREGFVEGSSVKPYYSGDTRHTEYTLTAGAIHRLGRHVNLFEGAGYGSKVTAWKLADSEGGGWLRNEGFSRKGFAAEIGTLVTWGKVSLAASVMTIAAKHWQGCVGIGIAIGKHRHSQK